jgi:hypothetical protein
MRLAEPTARGQDQAPGALHRSRKFERFARERAE